MVILIACLATFEMIMLSSMGFSWNIILLDGLSLFFTGYIFLNLIYIIQRYYHTTVVLNVANLTTVLLFTALTVIINYFICSTYFQTNLEYMQYLKYATSTKAILTFLALIVALMFFWIDQQKVQEERLKSFAIEKEREALAIELKSLQQQFKPHFLFNSLNSINALTLSNPNEARKMIHLLSEFMRGSIRNNDELVPITHEISHIKLYTEIEKVRFGNRLSVHYSIDDDVEDLNLPSLILQPLIENSIKYGLYGHTEEVLITIVATKEGEYLKVVITNPYDDVSSSGARGTGYGLTSIEKKMMILYNQSNLLKVENIDGQFIATIKIPQT